MHDFDYDAWQKKIITQSASKRKSGKSAKHFSLPQDTMTKKQLAERNGMIVTYNLGKPMTWAEFKMVPVDIQREYLDGLRRNFNVPDFRLAQMFEVTGVTVLHYLETNGLRDSESRRMTTAQKDRWNNFLDPCTDDEIEEKPDEIEEKPTEIEEKPTEPETTFCLSASTDMRLTMSTTGTAEQLMVNLQSLFNVVDIFKKYRINISITEVIDEVRTTEASADC